MHLRLNHVTVRSLLLGAVGAASILAASCVSDDEGSPVVPCGAGCADASLLDVGSPDATTADGGLVTDATDASADDATTSDAGIDAKKVKRVVVCAGQVYYDLLNARREREVNDIAIIRLEQLYPFPTDTFREELVKFPAAKEVMWVQEEPRNQGAWLQIRHRLEAGLGPKQTLAYAGRVSSASPAVGYMSKHVAQLKAFLEEAMTLKK